MEELVINGQPPTFPLACARVSLARACFTSEFGMGSGMTTPEMPPSPNLLHKIWRGLHLLRMKRGS